MKFFSIISLMLVLPSLSFAFGERNPYNLSDNTCLKGSPLQVEQQARQVLLSATGNPSVPMNVTVESVLPGNQHTAFTLKLHQSMDILKCAFSDDAKFDTFGDALKSIENKSYQVVADDNPHFLKPGFEGIIGGSNADQPGGADNVILFVVTTEGFVPHVCEKDPNTADSKPPAPTPDLCPPMFNSSVFIPIKQLLETTSGVKAAIMTVLKALGSVSLIVWSNFSGPWPLLQPIAQVGSAILAPDPLGTYERDQMVDAATTNLLSMGNRREKLDGTDDNLIVTRLLPYKYEDLKAAIQHIVAEDFKDDYNDLDSLDGHPNDPNLQDLPALKIERDFRNRMLQQRAAVVASPSPSPSAAPSPSPSASPSPAVAAVMP